MVDPKDAEGIKVPVCMLASKDEDPEAVKKFGEGLTKPSHIETFGDQVHGWMAARYVSRLACLSGEGFADVVGCLGVIWRMNM